MTPNAYMRKSRKLQASFSGADSIKLFCFIKSRQCTVNGLLGQTGTPAHPAVEAEYNGEAALAHIEHTEGKVVQATQKNEKTATNNRVQVTHQLDISHNSISFAFAFSIKNSMLFRLLLFLCRGFYHLINHCEPRLDG